MDGFQYWYLPQVTFTSGDEMETDVDNAEKQSDNSCPIVNIE